MNPLQRFHSDTMRRAPAEGTRAIFFDGLLNGNLSLVANKRQFAIVRWSYGVPNERALRALAALSPLVEVGAGSGYWASLLAERGANVVAFDTYEWRIYRGGTRYFPVRKGGWREAREHFAERALFMCWPPMEGWTTTTLREYRRAGGRTLACVSEGPGGMCGTNGFWNEVKRNWKVTRRVAIPHWPMIHDDLVIYERKGGVE